MSETISVKTEYHDPGAFDRAALSIGATLLARGEHQLFQTRETGRGLKLPGWFYPVVLRDDCSLAFDHYQGHWGNPADLDKLQAAYTVEVAALEAEARGWYVERRESGGLAALSIHTGGGRTVEVSLAPDVVAGGYQTIVEATGYQGIGCHADAGAIAEAIGAASRVERKPEFNRIHQQIREG